MIIGAVAVGGVYLMNRLLGTAITTSSTGEQKGFVQQVAGTVAHDVGAGAGEAVLQLPKGIFDAGYQFGYPIGQAIGSAITSLQPQVESGNLADLALTYNPVTFPVKVAWDWGTQLFAGVFK